MKMVAVSMDMVVVMAGVGIQGTELVVPPPRPLHESKKQRTTR
jgi:hypothetical protein